MRKTIVEGCAIVPAGDELIRGTTVYIQIEETSRAGDSARIVGTQTIANVDLTPGQDSEVSFSVPAEIDDEKGRYGVRVHVSCSGSKDVDVGDFVTTQFYPVLTHGYGTQAVVRLNKVVSSF